MKNKNLLIFLIILLSVVVFSLVMFMVKCLNGSFSFADFPYNFSSGKSKIIYEKDLEIPNLKELNIDYDLGNIDINNSENDAIRVEIHGENEEEVAVDYTETALNIKYVKKKKISLGIHGENDKRVIVYLPRNYSQNVTINSDCGNIKIADFANANTNIISDCGNIKIERIKYAKIKSDLGNIKIDEITEKCDLVSDCGNIDIKKADLKQDSSIKTDYGNVKIEEASDICFDVKVDTGKTTLAKNNQNSEVTLKIESDCGNVKVEK